MRDVSDQRTPDRGEVTRLLDDVVDGKAGAFEALYACVGPVLREMARGHLNRYNQFSMMPTELVDDAFMRLLQSGQLSVNNRRHFYALSARAMRDVIVDRIRRSSALKRKAEGQRTPLEELASLASMDGEDILDVNEALGILEREDPRAHETILLKTFQELTIDQIAEVMELSRATVVRDLKFAKARLLQKITELRDS